ncbi:gasdermin-E-like isoform X2 [Melanotaenia boesemani]|uniref:gasdermin-E-like isoform X2 n=1 Tax=Melanotaenia boesemani TaxID=1250792 RepID=UPI001C03F8B4|nr:gasdermin-E-like isoform X2 [Melanotaenia boesemani]
MFSKATAKFVRQVDPDGSLIHVSRVNDSQKLAPMALVVKRNCVLPWQKPKYQPTDFTLSDLLLGDSVLSPGVSDAEFLTYKEIYGDDQSGTLDTNVGHVSVALEGRGTSKLQSCFGKLKKEELDVKKLLRDSHDRLVDMQHVLVQQLEKRAEVLAVVKERILTTSSCTVTLTKQQQCTFRAVLGLLGLLGSSVKVCVKDVNNIEINSDISLEIPSGTVIAYSILELEIKKNGHYDICLRPSTIGGFEEDNASAYGSPDHSFTTVDGKINGHTIQDKASQGSQEMELSPLAELPQSTRCSLIKKLQETLKDRAVLSYLQCMLEKLCSQETVDTSFTEELPEILRNAVILPQDSESLTENVPAYLNAAYLLVSAMEELPDKTLIFLSESQPDFLEAFDKLLRRLKESSKPLSIHYLPISLQVFQQAEQLLGTIGVTLRREAEQLWRETENDARFLSLVLSIRGLSLLCTKL